MTILGIYKDNLTKLLFIYSRHHKTFQSIYRYQMIELNFFYDTELFIFSIFNIVLVLVCQCFILPLFSIYYHSHFK